MDGNADIIKLNEGDIFEAKLVQKYKGNNNPAKITAPRIFTLVEDSIAVPINKPKETADNPPARTAIIIMSQWFTQRQLNAKIINEAVKL
jgi:hypothetical protein